MFKGIQLNGGEVLELESEVVRLAGVWDLPMIGGERWDVEHEYQLLTAGPPVTLSSLEGAFVQDDAGTIFQLQESFDENEFQAGSRAHLEQLKARIAENKIDPQDADRLLRKHAEERRQFLERLKEGPKSEGYYPMSGLPRDSLLAVKTKALRVLQEKVETRDKGSDTMRDARAETTYQNIIGGLLDLMLGTSPGGKPQSMFKNQSAIIDALMAHHKDKPGISQRTLQEKFAASKRSITGS